ncbi:MAG: CpsD/CapB family tyrosine-protein kinase [Candidatus Sumerlaeia bacterium]
MSRFLDQIRKAKQAREEALKRASQQGKVTPRRGKDTEKERSLVPEVQPPEPKPEPKAEKTPENLFPGELEKNQEQKIKAEKAREKELSENRKEPELFPDDLGETEEEGDEAEEEDNGWPKTNGIISDSDAEDENDLENGDEGIPETGDFSVDLSQAEPEMEVEVQAMDEEAGEEDEEPEGAGFGDLSVDMIDEIMGADEEPEEETDSSDIFQMPSSASTELEVEESDVEIGQAEVDFDQVEETSSESPSELRSEAEELLAELEASDEDDTEETPESDALAEAEEPEVMAEAEEPEEMEEEEAVASSADIDVEAEAVSEGTIPKSLEERESELLSELSEEPESADAEEKAEDAEEIESLFPSFDEEVAETEAPEEAAVDEMEEELEAEVEAETAATDDEDTGEYEPVLEGFDEPEAEPEPETEEISGVMEPEDDEGEAEEEISSGIPETPPEPPKPKPRPASPKPEPAKAKTQKKSTAKPRPVSGGKKPRKEKVAVAAAAPSSLFPSELEAKDMSEDEEEYYADERDTDTGSVLFHSDSEAVSTPQRRRKRNRLSRGEIPIPGPEVNKEFLNRIARVVAKPDKRVLSYYDPKHHICEEYRLLGKNILHSFANGGDDLQRGKVIVLTSSVRGEGKTLTSMNLAITLAQDLSDRVLLIDGDLRHPKINRYIGLPPGSGVNDLVEAHDPEEILEDCLLRTDSGLHLLLSQSTRGNPAPILDSPKMTHVLDILRDHYSLIILDTPPVLLATDALTLGARSDGMLFLFRARKTQREQIQEARQRIARLDIRLLGYVINNVKSFLPKIWSRYYYGNY